MSITKVTYSMIDGAPVNVLDLGADPTGVADSSAALQAAANIGGQIYLPSGTYRISTQVTLTSGCFLIGEGATETIIQADEDVNPLLFEDASVSDYTGAGISNLKIVGNGANVRLVTVNNVWGFYAEHCWVRGVPTVFRAIEVQRYSFECWINSCRITDASESCLYLNSISGESPNGATIINCDFSPDNGGYAIYNEAGNAKVIGNWIEYAFPFGGTAIYSASGIRIIGNNISNGYAGAYAIYLDGTQGSSIIGNAISITVADGTAIYANNATDTVIDGNTFVVDYADYVVAIDGGSERTVISNNTIKGIVGGSYELLAVFLASGTSVDTKIVNNAFSYAGSATGKGVIVGANTTLTNITGNTFIGVSTGVDVQTNASNRRATIVNNNLSSITWANILDVYIYNNQGFPTEAGGTATITSGNTSVTVAHGLSTTPRYFSAALSGGATTNAVQGPIVVSADGTNIVFGCSANPGVSGMSITWQATFSI